MPLSHFKMVESFDWTTNPSDIILRYQQPGGSGSYNIVPGRFGGNAIQNNGFKQFFFQPLPGIDAGPWGPNVSLGFAFKCETAGPGQTPRFDIWHGPQPTTGHDQFTIICNLNNGSLEIHRGNAGALLAAGPTGVLTGLQWFYIQFRVFIDPASGSVQGFVGGVQQFLVTGLNTQGGVDNQFDSCLIGNQSGSSNIDYDDIYVTDTLTGPITERRVILLTPASDSAPLQWTPSTGTTHFNLVNEIPPDGDGTYVFSSTPTQEDQYNLSALPYAPAVIDTVQGGMYVRKDDAGARSVSFIMKNNSSAAVFTITSTYDSLVERWDNDPSTGVAWAPGTGVVSEMGILEVA